MPARDSVLSDRSFCPPRSARGQKETEGAKPMNAEDPVVVVGAARTPMGGFLGELKDASAPALGARAISAAVERANIPADSIDEILRRCVLPAGQGHAPARQAAMRAARTVRAGASTRPAER